MISNMSRAKRTPRAAARWLCGWGESISCCPPTPPPTPASAPGPALAAPPVGCPASCPVSPGRCPGTHRAATHVSVPASAPSDRRRPASTCKARRHPQHRHQPDPRVPLPPLAPVQARETPRAEAGRALRCRGAKPGRGSCREDPSVPGIIPHGGAEAAQTLGGQGG